MENCSSSTPSASSSASSSSFGGSGSSSSSHTKPTLRALLDDEKFTMNPLPNPSVDCKENRDEWKRILNEINIEQLSNNDYLYGTCNCSHISAGLLLEEKGLHEEALLVWIECCNSHHAYGQYKVALRHFHGWFLYLDLFRAKELLFASANKGLIHSICFLVRYPLPLKASERLGQFKTCHREDRQPDDRLYEGTPINSIQKPIASLEATKRRVKLLCEPMTEDEYLTMKKPNSYSPSLDKIALIYLKLSNIDTTIFHYYEWQNSSNLLVEGTQSDFDSLHAFANLFHFNCAMPFHKIIGEEIRASEKLAIHSKKILRKDMLWEEESVSQQTMAHLSQLEQAALLYLKLLSNKGHMAGLNSLLELYQTGFYAGASPLIRTTIPDHCSLLVNCAKTSVLAQEKLGYYHLTKGSGIEFDFEKAEYYAKLAAEGGAVTAEENYIAMHAVDYPHSYHGNGIYIAITPNDADSERKSCGCCQLSKLMNHVYQGKYLPNNNE